MSWSTPSYNSLCRCYNRLWHDNMNRRLLVSSCQVLNGCVKFLSLEHALDVATNPSNLWQLNDTTTNLQWQTHFLHLCPCVFAEKSRKRLQLWRIWTEIVEMAPDVTYIWHFWKLIFCIRAWRIASDNSGIVSFCQAGAGMMPAWCQVW